MSYKQIDLEQNTPEWLAYRKEKIGASDAPSIMGVGFDTPYKKWMEKLGFGEEKKGFQLDRGRQLEPVARQEFTKKTGIMVVPTTIESTIYPFLIASLDGLDFNAEKAVEIKVPGFLDHQDALNGKVPDKYYPQLQHQMFILQIPMIYYYSYAPESQALIEVPYDGSYIIDMVEKEKEFYQCIQELTPPPLMDRDYVISTDPVKLEKAISLISVKRQIKELKAQEDKLKQELSPDVNEGNLRVGDLSITKIVKKGNVDYSAIPELLSVDLEKYRKPSTTYFRFSG